MYPDAVYGMTSTAVSSIHVVPKGVDSISEGSARPGFFTGVATVVAKLFNLVQPAKAYFGQKDGIQVMTVRRLVRDLNFPLKIVPCDTVREDDGLAASSRNVYLSPEQRAIAPVLYQSLLAVREKYEAGERSYQALADTGRKMLQSDQFKIQYFSLCDALTGEEFDLEKYAGRLPEENIMVSAAIHFGNCRILDNVLLGKQT